ncbi:unnamed protein product [Polarella glacialis]|uniref:Uncharacterized protein n=1 Tax=Polarella glacialis TaxID=89957 RepID=A0A813GA52_POLGL|nr:unnamed protein product [Polarella glacialis]
MVLAARPYSYDLGEPTTTPTNIRQKVNLGDAMGDMKFAGSNPYLDANKQALIHSARNLWGSHQEPQAYMGFANGQSAGHGIRSIGPTSDGSFDGSHFLGHEDGLSSYLGHGDDNQRTEDEKLLAMLSDMAKGAADDDSDVMSLLPVEVQEDDPIVRSLLAQCGSMWEEVHAEAEVKNELQSRLRRELRQLQERSERQYQESTVFMQRLASAKQTLADKLKESSLANQELRARINSEWRQNERLRCTISEGVKSLTARAAELSAQIWEVSDSQATLVEQIQVATATQARLQTELQEERAATWRQSADVVTTFARGGPAGVSASSGAKGPSWEDSGIKALEARQAKQVEELNQELEREKTQRSSLEAELLEVTTQAAARGIPTRRGLDTEDGSAAESQTDEVSFSAFAGEPVVSLQEVLKRLHEVEELRSELEMKRREAREAEDEKRQAEEKLQAEQDELVSLQASLDSSEGQSLEHAKEIGEAEDLIEVLRDQIKIEQASLREEEHSADRRRELFRSQVASKRAELARLHDVNESLTEDLERKTGCFGGGGSSSRNRPAESYSPPQQANGNRGGVHQGRPGPPGRGPPGPPSRGPPPAIRGPPGPPGGGRPSDAPRGPPGYDNSEVANRRGTRAPPTLRRQDSDDEL